MLNIRPRFLLSILIMLFLLAGVAQAQLRIDLRNATRPFEFEAVAGQPYGVGRITFELPQDRLPGPLGIEGIGLAEKQNRALYPTLDNPAFGKVMREILGSDTPLTTGGPVRQQVGGILRDILDRPPRTTLYFLFRGDEPLELSLQSQPPIPLSIVPRKDPIAHKRLLQLWWKQYAKPASLLESRPDYPPVVDNFLMSTLARRLSLNLPEDRQIKSADSVLQHEIGLNLGTESLRMAMQQDRILGLNNLNQPADQPLPLPAEVPELSTPEPAADVKIEPIAMRVPVECFYARFGSFANFLWLQDTLAKWGGDAQNLIAMRGLDRGMSTRMETQLILKQTALSRMLGDTVIADVAIIGTDMFFREGASYGFLFQARNNFMLTANFAQQRQERIKAGGVAEQKVKIGDKTVSYITSPDGRVRSYYAIDGDYHFFTTSRALAARFLATSSGKQSLGASREFRHARSVMPMARGDTVWLYVSDAFFRNITGPFYRTEMTRRLQAAADIELVQLAKLAAAGEGRPCDSIDKLKAISMLPSDFGPLPDGSRAVLESGEVVNNIRGRLGAFVPVSDMMIDKVTRAEAAEYAKFAEYYREKWGRMDPIIAGVKRTPLEKNQERVVVDVLMSPLAPEHFQTLAQRLGPADSRQLAVIPGDMAATEIILTNQRVFAGMRDVGRPPAASVASLLPIGRLRDFLVGYIGTDGELGVLSILNVGISPQADAAGYAGSPLGGWRRQFDRFTLFSFQRELLEEVAPQLQYQQAQRPAQVRVRIDDLSNARITPALNDLGYARTRETSLNNLRLLHALDQQLHVPPAACQEAAEFLLDAKLTCPLGGRYVLQEDKNKQSHWTSTALGSASSGGLQKVHAPQGYQTPPLRWFRGLNLDAVMTEKNISAHAEVIMQMPEKK